MCEAVFCNLGKGRLSLFEIVCHLLKIIFIYHFSKCPRPKNFYYFMIYVTEVKTRKKPEIALEFQQLSF